MEWSEDKCLQLVDAYREKRLLWDSKHPQHYHKWRRKKAWHDIADLMQTDSEYCRRKITTLQASFRREKAKVKKSAANGTTDPDELYSPTWFAYERLKFLCDKDMLPAETNNKAVPEENVDFSLKEDDLLMILTACNLLKEVFKHPGKWPQVYVKALQNIMAHVGQCMEKVGNLLNMPTSLASRILRFERNLNDPVELPQHVVCDRTQMVQKRLLSLYIACLSVLKCMCPDYSDIVSADPLGIELDTICPHFVPTTTIEELITLVGSVNLFTKSLAKTQNLKASPHSPIQQIQSPVADEYSLLNRLPECSEEDIHLALELSVHYLISNVLMFIYFNRINSRQQVLFIRDLSSELSLFVEYVRRLCVDIGAIIGPSLMIPVHPNPLTYSVASEDESDMSMSTGGEIPKPTVVPETDEATDDSYEEEKLVGHPKGPQFLVLAAQLLKQIFNLVEKPQQ